MTIGKSKLPLISLARLKRDETKLPIEPRKGILRSSIVSVLLLAALSMPLYSQSQTTLPDAPPMGKPLEVNILNTNNTDNNRKSVWSRIKGLNYSKDNRISKIDMGLMALYTGLSVVDWKQTHYRSERPFVGFVPESHTLLNWNYNVPIAGYIVVIPGQTVYSYTLKRKIVPFETDPLLGPTPSPARVNTYMALSVALVDFLESGGFRDKKIFGHKLGIHGKLRKTTLIAEIALEAFNTLGSNNRAYANFASWNAELSSLPNNSTWYCIGGDNFYIRRTSTGGYAGLGSQAYKLPVCGK